MQTRGRAIGAVVSGAVVVALIAVAAGAYYFLSTPVSTNSTSPSSKSGASTSFSSSTTTELSSTDSDVNGGTTAATSETSSASTETTTCTSTMLSASPTSGLNFAPLFGDFSAMSMSFSGSGGGVTNSLNSSYAVVYASPTTYKVTVSSNATGDGGPVTAWILRDGTVVAAAVGDQNLTGTVGEGLFESSMAPFTFEISYNSVLGYFTSADYVHVAGTGNVTLGDSRLAVIDFAANSLPLTISACGSSFALTDFSLQTGAVSGANFDLITRLRVTGTETNNGQQASINFLLQVLSITKA